MHKVAPISGHVAKDPSFLHADSEDFEDWADAKADLSLRWAHRHLVVFVMSRLRLQHDKLWSLVYTPSRSKVSHVTGKPVFGVCDQV